jgi:hypothetical protein
LKNSPKELENVSVRWNFASRLSELASQRFVTELLGRWKSPDEADRRGFDDQK